MPIGSKKSRQAAYDKAMCDGIINYEKPTGMYSFKKNGYSPTKRLIKMRNSALKHKEQLCSEDPGSIHPHCRDKYRIAYTTSPDKFFVMKPEAEIDYDMHKTSPKKFYKQVFDQEVEKIKVKESHDGY
jgi:hypothetical protein